MELETRKGFVYTLEAIIASILLLTTATIIVPQFQAPKHTTDEETQDRVRSGLETLDKTGQLRDNLTLEALESDIESAIPGDYNYSILLRDVDTEEIQIDVDNPGGSFFDYEGGTDLQSEWTQGIFNGTSVDRNDNSGNLSLGYENGTSDDNLVGFWRMDRNSGSFIDYSGNENSGTNNGANRGTSGIFSTSSFDFDGSDDYAWVGSSYFNSTTTMTDKFTISFWAKPDANDGMIVVKEERGSDNTGSMQLEINNGIIELGKNNEAENGSSSELSNDIWQHAAIVFDGANQEVSFYINGDLDATRSTTYSSFSYTNPVLMIGRRGAANDLNFDGTLDEFRIYNRTLSSSEVRNLYFDGQQGSFTGNYTRNFTISDGTPKKIQIKSRNIDTSGNVSWANVFTDQGELTNINLDSGSNDKNYSLGFTQQPSEVSVSFNFTANNQTPVKSPIIDNFKLWLNKSSGQTYLINKSGSISLQYHLNSSSNFNATFGGQKVIKDESGQKYGFADLPDTNGSLNLFGTAEGILEIRNTSIKGQTPDLNEVKNVNHIINQNGTKELTVSLWQ